MHADVFLTALVGGQRKYVPIEKKQREITSSKNARVMNAGAMRVEEISRLVNDIWVDLHRGRPHDNVSDAVLEKLATLSVGHVHRSVYRESSGAVFSPESPRGNVPGLNWDVFGAEAS